MQSAAERSDDTTQTGQSMGSGPEVTYLVGPNQVQIVTAEGTRTFGSSDFDDAGMSYGTAKFLQTDFKTGNSYELDINKPSVKGAVNRVSLTYTRVGTFIQSDKHGSYLSAYTFVFGAQTPPDGMPRTGSADYATTYSAAIGDKHPATTPIFFGAGDNTGLATFSADFLGGAVSTSIDLNNAQHYPDSTLKSFGTINGTGAIASNSSAFDGTFTDPGVSGEFHGSFFGPDAAEMGMVFHASSSDFEVSGDIEGKKK